MNNGWKKDYLRYKDFFLSVASVYNTKPNLKIYLELILSLTTITIFSIFAIKPTILTIIDLSKEIKTKEETSIKLRQKIRDLQTISNLLQNEIQDIQFVDQAVPKSPKPEILIKQLEKISTESSLKILSFSLSDVTLLEKNQADKKNKGELEFSFSASGSYQNILSFIHSVENLRRPVKFNSFIINSNVTENGKIIVLTVGGSVPYDM